MDPDYYELLAASSKSQDKSTAFFSSNRHEGVGGFDIFTVSQNKKSGQWEHPRSFSEINTEKDEYGVVLHPSGHTLYFSSNGYQTMGGYDIFKTEYDGKHWSKPENLGYPINSTADDIVYSISEDGNRLYFSSNRTSGNGDYDVYLVNFMPDVMPAGKSETLPVNVSAEAIGTISSGEPLTVSEASAIPATVTSSGVAKYPAALNGFISDNQTYMPLNNVTLRLLDKSNNAEEVIDTDSKGVFYAILSAGGSYRIAIDAPGYHPYEEDFKVSEEVGQKLSKNISLSPLLDGSADVVASVIPEQQTATAEPEEEYEDIVVLAPVVASDEPEQQQPQAVKEYPVAVTGLITDNETFAPINAAQITVMLKDSNDEHVFESNNKGLVNFYLASGNTYTIIIDASDYEFYVEEFVTPDGPDQKLSKTFQLQTGPSLVTEEVEPNISSIDLLGEEDAAVMTPIVNPVLDPVLEEPEPEVEIEIEEEVVEVQPEPEPVVVAEVVPEPEVVVEPEPEIEVVEVQPEPEPVQESDILYEEDIVVLTPVLPLTDENDTTAENREYPVNLKIYVSDSKTLLPLAVPVRLTVKNTDIDNTLNTDEKGMLDVTIASGNTYRLGVEYEGYISAEEEFDVVKGPGQFLTRNILLSPVAPAVAPETVVAEVIEAEEEPEPEVNVQPEPEPAVVEEPEPTIEPATEIEPVIVPVEETPVEEIPVVEETPVVAATPEPVVEKASAESSAPAVIVLSGTIVSADTRKPVTTAAVTLTDATRGITEEIQVSKGKFTVNALAGSNYSVKVTAEGYQTVVRDMATSSNDREIDLPVELHPVTEAFVVNVSFDFDRAALNERAEQALQDAIALLKEGKTVYLIGHTDNAGGAGYNKRLSERRAETVSTYLRVHGIAPDDVKISWKGLSNPVETNFTTSGRKLNNRVEIWMK
jgi:outer membrane protein OmpA-like peptidoglycan-associated protein